MSWKARLRARVAEVCRVAEVWGPARLVDFENYDDYWDNRQPVDVVHRRWEVSRNIIPDGASVLDIGCGVGGFLEYLRRERPAAVLVGVDLSANAVARALDAGIDARVLDIAAQRPEGIYDYVTCHEVVEHIAHAERALDNLMAVTRCRSIISIPNVGFIGCRLRLGLFGRFPITSCVFHMREHLRFWTVKDFHEWIDDRGYRIVHQEPQHGVWVLWRRFPSLFASGMVYSIEHRD